MSLTLSCAGRTSWLAGSACSRACAVRPRLASIQANAHLAVRQSSESSSSRPTNLKLGRIDPTAPLASGVTVSTPHEREYNFVARLTADGAFQIKLYHGGRGEEQDRAEIRSVPVQWLRDQCQCSKCINPDTKQRKVNIFSLPDSTITECSINDTSINVTWNDGHLSSYEKSWLGNAFKPKNIVRDKSGNLVPSQWHKISQDPPEVEHDAVMDTSSNKGLAEWMLKTRLYGFCFVNNTPPTPEATEALLNRIGPIRNTHYGGFWDFTSNMAFADTAYTDEALDVHTDTNYFSDSAGLQMFHLLEHDGTGGESQLVDGFQCAQNMRKKNKAYYDSLARTKMFFHASGNEGLSIQPQTPFPVLVHDEITGDLVQIRWNPYDKAAFAVNARAQPEQLDVWYQAAKTWNNLLQQDKPSVRYEFQLKPGRPLLFDNWRVLHGRSSFTGKRRMCGGYINRDDFISRFKTTNYGHSMVLKNGIY